MFYIKKKIIYQKTTTLDEQHARILEEIRLGRMGIKGERCGMKVYQYGLRLGEVDMVEMNCMGESVGAHPGYQYHLSVIQCGNILEACMGM